MEELLSYMPIVGAFSGVAIIFLTILIACSLFRRVVSTNEVHIVQSSKSTMSYGTASGNGNTYYEWPAWLPMIGVQKVVLPTFVFGLDLKAYEAYDKGRLPFVVDVKAFFRIVDSNVAAHRVHTFKELHEQLYAIVQGAVRVILASHDIEYVLQGRATFGEQFTKEVAEQLLHWGVAAVKNIELMDIRDSSSSHVIANIMEKKKSHIEMESRTEVAKNRQLAQVAEIEAARIVDLEKRDAAQTVAMRQTEYDKKLQVEKQIAEQTVAEHIKTTREKEIAITVMQEMRQADLEKGVQLIKSEQDRRQVEIDADAEKTRLVLQAEGQAAHAEQQADAVEMMGEAKAKAEKGMQLATIEAQITLAKEIGENVGYQNYLISLKRIEAEQAVGIAQAQALQAAEIKVIANTGNVADGINSISGLLSSKGGTQIGTMLEGLAQTEVGKRIVDKVVGE